MFESVNLQTCRLCLARTSVHFCLIKNEEISEMLHSITSLQIPADDNISTVICYKCNLNLKLVYKIQQNMLKAETRFYEQVQVKPEIIEEPIEQNIINESENKVEIKVAPLEDTALKCDKCNKCFESKVQLRKHFTRTHIPATCRICQKSFQTKNSLARHTYTTHSTKGVQECDICYKLFPSSIQLKVHKYNHVLNECEVCGKNVRIKVMKAHMASHGVGVEYMVSKRQKNVKKEYRCEICDLTFSTGGKYWYHNSTIHATVTESLECPICKKPFTNKISLSNHKNLHKNTGPHPCDICGSTYISTTKLNQHKLTHLLVKCTVCNREVTRSNLPQHMLTHGEKQVCDVCGFQSTTKYNLKVHKLKKHGNPTVHKCEFCEKTFTKKSRKINHEKNLHLGEKTVQCEQCGKKFFNNAYLKRHFDSKHLKIVKSFKCEFCEKEFSSGYALKTHKRIHTNETPFKCEICGDGFRQKVSLKSHLKSKHKVDEELTEFCKECGKGFGSIIALQTHRRVHE